KPAAALVVGKRGVEIDGVHLALLTRVPASARVCGLSPFYATARRRSRPVGCRLSRAVFVQLSQSPGVGAQGDRPARAEARETDAGALFGVVGNSPGRARNHDLAGATREEPFPFVLVFEVECRELEPRDSRSGERREGPVELRDERRQEEI